MGRGNQVCRHQANLTQTFNNNLAMSALGHKRTYAAQQSMSALPPIATAKADKSSAPSSNRRPANCIYAASAHHAVGSPPGRGASEGARQTPQICSGGG